MPALNALLIDQGVTFSNYFVNVALCDPSRVTTLTGLYSHNHGATGNSNAYSSFDDRSTLATWLKGAGYRTGMFGKYLNKYREAGLYVPPGWNFWRAFVLPGYYGFDLIQNGTKVRYDSQYSTALLSSHIAWFVKATPLRQRVFVYFAPYAPHEPATPAGRDAGKFATLAPYRPPSYDEQDVEDKPEWVRAFPLLSEEDHGRLEDVHRRQVETLQAVDRAITTIVDALTQAGRIENTVFIYASDNGYSLGAHRIEFKLCPYEECIKQPLIIRAPGLAPGTSDALVSNIDLAATVAEYAGVAIPPTNGRSLVPLLAGTATEWRDEVLLEQLADVPANRKFYGLRTLQHLYVELFTGERELYDLYTDPFQLLNVAPENPDLVAALGARLAEIKGN